MLGYKAICSSNNHYIAFANQKLVLLNIKTIIVLQKK